MLSTKTVEEDDQARDQFDVSSWLKAKSLVEYTYLPRRIFLRRVCPWGETGSGTIHVSFIKTAVKQEKPSIDVCSSCRHFQLTLYQEKFGQER